MVVDQYGDKLYSIGYIQLIVLRYYINTMTIHTELNPYC